MGNTLPVSSTLSSLSKEEVACAVSSLGSKYNKYADTARDNGVDGEILATLVKEQDELCSLFDELEITSKLHRRVLTKSLVKAKKEEEEKQSNQPSLQCTPAGQGEALPEISICMRAAAEYGVDINTPREDVLAFEQIAVTILRTNSKASFASVNLMLEDAQHPIGTVVRRQQDGVLLSNRKLAYSNNKGSFCYHLVHGDATKDVLVRELRPGNGYRTDSYLGHVIKDSSSGVRIGTVCQVARLSNATDKDKQLLLLKKLAVKAEEELLKRKVALRIHNDRLKSQSGHLADNETMLSFPDDNDLAMENLALRKEILQLEQQRRLMNQRCLVNEKRSPPNGDVTFVFTDIQDSTLLWEADASSMEASLKIHDKIMRKCCADAYGYEVTTGGDAFRLAFHDPIDAISFALQAQRELHLAPWPDSLLSHPAGADDLENAIRGLRVRMGIHRGPVCARDHEITGRVRYMGESVRITECIENMCQGGQILVTMDTWREASPMMDLLGSPQVLDLGDNIVMATRNSASDGIVSKRILQLVPKDFAVDYGNNKGPDESCKRFGATGIAFGRRFPPAKGLNKISPFARSLGFEKLRGAQAATTRGVI